jgi:ParB family chromosome partitioning protein
MENTTEFLQTQRKDIYYVDARLLNVVPDFNVRQDYGDMDELVESIRENGVKVPIRGYKKEGVLYVVDGHRRLRACQTLIEQGVEMRVPYLPETGASAEQRIIDMITLNEGKKLNPLEESEAVKRLINYGFSEYDIAKKVGRTPKYIYNLKLLSSAPERLKVMIRSNIISATLVIDTLKSADSLEDATTIIEKAYYNNSNEGQLKQTRVTKKDIDNVVKKVNSFAELKKTFSEAAKKDWEY